MENPIGIETEIIKAGAPDAPPLQLIGKPDRD